MKISKILITLLLIILTIGAVSASDDNITSDELTVNEDLTVESSSNTQDEYLSDGNMGTFSELNELIQNTPENDTLQLNKNYVRNDSNLIIISKTLTIDGNGYELSNNNITGPIEISADNVVLKNVIFKNQDIKFLQSENSTIENCSFINCKDCSIKIHYHNNSIVNNCRFINCSNSAINMGASDYTLITNCNFTNCKSKQGGAICCQGSGLENIIQDCNFINCSADEGGAIYFDSSEKVIYGDWDMEYDYQGFDYSIVRNCNFRNCSANRGGSIYWGGAGGYLINSNFDTSYAGTGGAIYFEEYMDYDRQIIYGASGSSVANCNFRNCSAYNGGSIYWGGDYGSLSNSNFTSNHAEHDGGAIYGSNRDNLELSNSNFENNTAANNGGAVYCKNNINLKVINSAFKNSTSTNNSGPVYHENITNYHFIGTAEKTGDYYDLVKIIDESESGSTITLTDDYAIHTNDYNMVLNIDKAITIDGNGHSLYFGILATCKNVRLKNIIFKNLYNDHNRQDLIGTSNLGTENSMHNCSLVDCSFNYSEGYVSSFNAYDCTFINCYGGEKGGILNGNSTNSTFINCRVGKLSKMTNNSFHTTFINCSGYGDENTIYGNPTNCTSINFTDTRKDFYLNFEFEIHENDDAEPNDLKDVIIIILYSPDEKWPLISTLKNETGIIEQEIQYSGWSHSGLSPGNYTLIITYEGDSNTKPGNITKTITIEPPLPKPDISISTNSIQKGNVEEIIIKFPEDATGDIGILFNDNWNNEIITNSEVRFLLDTTNMALGNHTLDIYFNGDGKYRVSHHTFQINIYENHTDSRKDFEIVLKINVRENDENEPNDFKDIYISTYALPDMEPITATFNNKTQKINQNPQIGVFEWQYIKINPGNYTLIVSYDGDSNTKPGNITKTIIVEPSLPKADFKISTNNIQKGNKEEITVTFPEDATGGVSIMINGNSTYSPINNTEVHFNLDTTNMAIGKCIIEIKYSGNDKYRSSHKTFEINIYENQTKIDASDLEMTYTDGSTYTTTVYGADGTVEMETPVEFIIDGKTVKTTTTDKNGKATLTLTQIPGTYEITTKALGINITKKLTVKEILTLKTIKIKKSAKSLTLTATLSKINGKYLKNQKITFKFNGKTYKAKTNKKGVAKVTIKKSVLKKLKAGKKLTYSATYLKDTVKKTVKIKK